MDLLLQIDCVEVCVKIVAGNCVALEFLDEEREGEAMVEGD